MSLAFIIIFYPQILLRCVLNNFRSPKFHKFGDFFQPACLFHPARLLDTLEYTFAYGSACSVAYAVAYMDAAYAVVYVVPYTAA